MKLFLFGDDNFTLFYCRGNDALHPLVSHSFSQVCMIHSPQNHGNHRHTVTVYNFFNFIADIINTQRTKPVHSSKLHIHCFNPHSAVFSHAARAHTSQHNTKSLMNTHRFLKSTKQRAVTSVTLLLRFLFCGETIHE